MRRLLLPLILLVGACNNDRPPPHAQASENAAAAAAPAPVPAPPAVNAVQPRAPQTHAPDPPLPDLSPTQRRAYELGYRDCSQGRYAPANHLEAYRIGCAAAHAH